MVNARNAAEYAERMHRALDYRHLDETLALVQLAKIAHYSPLHFRRVFSALRRETFGEYRRRRRLEIAACCLVGQPQLLVHSMARVVGFGSAETFSRAHTLRFRWTPTCGDEEATMVKHSKLAHLEGKLNQAQNLGVNHNAPA